MIEDLCFSVPCQHALARSVRAAIREWLERGPFADGLVDDVLLTASELFANAVSSTSEDSEIEVSLRTLGTALILEVANSGVGFDLSLIPSPAPERLTGRGLAIVRTFGDLAVDQHDGRTVVRVTVPYAFAPTLFRPAN